MKNGRFKQILSKKARQLKISKIPGNRFLLSVPFGHCNCPKISRENIVDPLWTAHEFVLPTILSASFGGIFAR